MGYQGPLGISAVTLDKHCGSVNHNIRVPTVHFQKI